MVQILLFEPVTSISACDAALNRDLKAEWSGWWLGRPLVDA
jgi:hypothetical protein